MILVGLIRMAGVNSTWQKGTVGVVIGTPSAILAEEHGATIGDGVHPHG